MERRKLLSLITGGGIGAWMFTQAPEALARRKPRRRPAPRPAAPAVPWMKGNLPNVQSAAALTLDLDSGAELYAKRADTERPIASISKLAAALVAMDRGLDLTELTTITETDAEVARGGARSRLLTGMTVSNLDLLHAGLLGSDNRAISAMGRALGLSAAEYAREMTKTVRALGLKHTRFREPTGLSRENVSTPRETIAMLSATLAHPTLAGVLGRLEYSAHPVSRPSIPYVNTYKPALRRNTEILGGKTGFNDFARYCLVLCARVDGRKLGLAFLGAEGKLTRFGDFARVADWVVATKPHPKPTPPLGTGMAAAPGAETSR